MKGINGKTPNKLLNIHKKGKNHVTVSFIALVKCPMLWYLLVEMCWALKRG